MLGKWSIQARAFKIPLTPFAHNFWALVEPKGEVVDQIHGLAFDPKTRMTKAIGNSSHLLLAIHDHTITWSFQPNQPIVVCILGLETVVRERWQAALNALSAINALQLRYPNLWQHIYKMNSNSIFNTVGQIMGFTTPAKLLPIPAPGVRLVVSEKIIKEFCYTLNPIDYCR
ncbi:hypothetical protein SRRS_36870 [Sporomusa rhizae]|uniref:hypothetical protein n=1 Tax=Sporomusa rhizae TaxID=357999 RepID=UPI00352AE2B9